MKNKMKKKKVVGYYEALKQHAQKKIQLGKYLSWKQVLSVCLQTIVFVHSTDTFLHHRTCFSFQNTCLHMVHDAKHTFLFQNVFHSVSFTTILFGISCMLQKKYVIAYG